MKSILVITPYFYPHAGGGEQYIEGLYSYLKRKNPKLRIDVLCYNTEKSKSKEVYKGLNVYRIPCSEILSDQFALPKPIPLFNFLSKHRDYGLIHTSTRFFESSWWAILYAKLTKTKIVLTDHCAYHPVSSSSAVNIVVRLVEATIVRFSLHFYDEIFTENKKTNRFLKENFRVDSKVVYPGLFKSSFYKSKTKNKRVKIVYAGRLLESKGVKDLIEAAKVIKKADFVFAGEGSLLKELRRSARSLSNVRVLGKISQKEVMRLLSSADIFAYPSWHSEGLPLAIIEAGESGLAVIATQSGAIDEVIKNNETGILVAPKNRKAFQSSLGNLISDSSLRKKLGKNLQAYVLNNFSWDKASNLILDYVK